MRHNGLWPQGLTPRDLLLINHVVLSCCIVPTLPGGSSAL